MGMQMLNMTFLGIWGCMQVQIESALKPQLSLDKGYYLCKVKLTLGAACCLYVLQNFAESTAFWASAGFSSSVY